MSHYQIVIVGGGTAGITVAARLRNADPSLGIAIIEPSEKHYYQPLWTLVGGGMFKPEESGRNEIDLIPYGVDWVKDHVTSFAPNENTVVTRGGATITYDYLVVAPGIQVNWGQVKGLKDAVGKDGVCSNYSIDTVASTWKFIRNLKQGVALFTQPAGAVKCGGAPQKICYLAEDYFRRHGVRNDIDVIFTLAGPRLFAVDRYREILEKVAQRKGVEPRFRHNLVEIRSASREAIYRHMDTDEEIVIRYDMIHVTPPMSAPDFVSSSELASEDGWVDVDKYTLQHTRFANVFGIGDASSLPTSKTGAAIRKQAPVLVSNLRSLMKQEPLSARYDGYTSCPVVTGYDSLVLAEFDYSGQPAETFPFDQAKERFSMLMLKKFGLPALYWHGMLRGRA
ncbi:Sulfide dehydrogenase [flavocytochrome c] flavoprotein chain precursor [Rubripirellula amarantea]|uniref:Sulfide dehydrogenase [flavocytochrome c] flavoprotein chain n=1 Tax=Rubripirellula amarantea TaxID=2527999 RepID=A0A5C5WGS1_9BACT|nr:FAD/NAD(P)-binding oxidoreductase [Rubripirellula amarantea]TWT49309.1 Sulfide dehydrogenase [flavocytochrome c] flavoprotein chain precursor [Rubripirellula amarantea]